MVKIEKKSQNINLRSRHKYLLCITQKKLKTYFKYVKLCAFLFFPSSQQILEKSTF